MAENQDPLVSNLLVLVRHLVPLDKGIKLARALKIAMNDVNKCDRGRVLADVPRSPDDIDPAAIQAWNEIISLVRKAETDDSVETLSKNAHVAVVTTFRNLRELVSAINSLDEHLAVRLGTRGG